MYWQIDSVKLGIISSSMVLLDRYVRIFINPTVTTDLRKLFIKI